tara:strand:- start:54 stop:1001 length:948 start_codon:yes stop_codon:yes gene_type:complete
MIKSILIQNFFRFGGTYLYNQITEKNQNVLGFYEPFHEHLSDYERIKEEKKIFESKNKRLRHYSKSFYYSNFPHNEKWFKIFHQKNKIKLNLFHQTKNDEKEYINYIKELISIAHNKNEIPIFKINRLYFSPTIFNITDSLTIFLIRQPVSSFFSNIDLNFLRPYYKNIETLALQNIQPFFDLQKIIKNNKIKEISIKDEKLHFDGRQQLILHYSIFFFLWIYGLNKNIFYSNLLINYDYLSNIEYSNSIKSDFFLKTNLILDLDNFKRIENKLHNLQLEIIDEVSELIFKYINYNKLKEELKIRNCNNLLTYLI